MQATDDVIIVVTRLPELSKDNLGSILQPLNIYDVDEPVSVSSNRVPDPADLSVTDLDNRSILTSFRKQNLLL